MKKETKIHFYCEICWLPGSRDKPLYSPKRQIFHMSRFTKDVNQAFDVVVYFDDKPIDGKPTCNRAQLVFMYGLVTKDFTKLIKLADKAELVLFDGYSIKAVCRNLVFVGEQNLPFGQDLES